MRPEQEKLTVAHSKMTSVRIFEAKGDEVRVTSRSFLVSTVLTTYRGAAWFESHNDLAYYFLPSFGAALARKADSSAAQ